MDISKQRSHDSIVRIQIELFLETTAYLLSSVGISNHLMVALLNMNNIPNQIISGVSSEELEMISEESSERMIEELDLDMFRDVDFFMSENENTYQELPNERNAE